MNITKDLTDRQIPDLTDRQIPGVTGKQIIALIVFLVAGTTAYVDIKNGVNAGRKERSEMLALIREMSVEMKQDNMLDDARMRALEIEMNECQLRIEFFQKFIEGYNKQNR